MRVIPNETKDVIFARQRATHDESQKHKAFVRYGIMIIELSYDIAVYDLDEGMSRLNR